MIREQSQIAVHHTDALNGRPTVTRGLLLDIGTDNVLLRDAWGVVHVIELAYVTKIRLL